MSEIAQFDKQYLLAAKVIVALSADLGDPMYDFSEVGEVDGRKAHMELIRQISDMAGPWDRDNVPERGLSDELSQQIRHFRINGFFSEELSEILEAFVDALKALWIGDPTAGMTSDELKEYGIYLARKAEFEAAQEGA